MNLSIRTAKQGDIDALSELARQTYSHAFGHSFTPDDLEAHLQNHLSLAHVSRFIEKDVILVAEMAGRLIGYLQFGPMDTNAEGNDWELRRLYVHSDFQNQGVGTRLMEAILQHPQWIDAANIYLDVWEHNPGAQRLYQRFGFEVIGTRAFTVASGAETSLDLSMVRRAK